MTFSRIYGAKTLDPGQVEAGFAVGARAPDDPAFPLPIPQVPFLLRVGVRPDLDLGLRGYLLGGGVDLRWRFLHEDRWHLAINPGFGAILQPSLLNLGDLGAIESNMPLLAEYELTRWLSVAAGAHVTYRNRLNLSVDGAVWRFDVYGGAGARIEAHPGILVFGLYADVLTAPTRHTGLPMWAGGLDFKLRTLSSAQIAERKGEASTEGEDAEEDGSGDTGL